MNHQSLRKIILDNKLDAVLITSVPNIIYLTNYNGFSQIEREAYMLVTKKSHHLVTDSRYTNAINNLSTDLILHEITSANPLTTILERIINSENIKIIGFESENLTVSEYIKMKKVKVKFKLMSFTNLRILKTPDEIKKIKKSCDLANEVLSKIQPQIKTGMSEKDIALLIEFEVKRMDAELSFPTIVAFNENAATPHHLTSGKLLSNNSLILIDFGVKYENYCSDMTRTFFHGIPNSKQLEIYQIVSDAQQIAIDFIIDNLKSNKKIQLSKVDFATRGYIISKKYPTIPHSLGHGIGIEVHESPRLSPNSKDILEEGMVFSIEPGIYLPGITGVRIEDLFAIQKNKLIKLT